MSLVKAIRITINYAKKFQGGLTSDELFYRLITNKVYSKGQVLRELGKVSELPRSNKKKFLRNKLIKARKLADLVQKQINEIVFMGISGSVAAGYPNRGDDIDLVIITKKNCLWLARFKLWWLEKNSHFHFRHYGQIEMRNYFCPNIWIEDEYLVLPKEKRNRQSAIDLILVKPLINKYNAFGKLIESNKWANKYVANGYKELKKRTGKTIITKGETLRIVKILNEIMYFFQRLYMWPKIKKEIISRRWAFFHKQ